MTSQVFGNIATTTPQQLFAQLQQQQYSVANTTAKTRIQKLKRLRNCILQHRTAIYDALFADFKKSTTETDLTETLAVVAEINFAIRHLHAWTAKQAVNTPLKLIGTSSYIQYEPKGVVLIIAPWNFPINLLLSPLVSAVAAGNCVVLKPSEFAPHSAAVMKKIIAEVFDENEVAFLEGDHTLAQQLLQLPFNHIFFTGSPQVGKIVMQAAAKNLTSITLELGGKSPVIVDDTADLQEVAEKVGWVKCMNTGQICIAPDYLLISPHRLTAFLDILQKQIIRYYGKNPALSPDYPRIINAKHFQRIKQLLDDAVLKGANMIKSSDFNEADNYIPPIILTNVSANMLIMQEEIFGPILPIMTIENIEQAVRFINQGEKPLALYIFSNDKKNTEFILQNTRSGNACINECGTHFYNHYLPFGGVNNSGIGKAHGLNGFLEFSNAKGITKRSSKLIGLTKLVSPPYNRRVQTIVDIVLKWLA
ncbi:MAG: aldehyde dehydrogenase family protein [Saprospiraceae bacterium]|nr:aldehyde dehydrogenase family protein [Saprospiraceae bacterium]MBP7680174.1 aldehyde dehydrogenase family protein [Saprospiraceae bacterium]